MDSKKAISDLKQVLSKPGEDGQVDVNAIHGILGNLNDKEYVELAKSAFEHQLATKDKQCKAIFGIAISYARDSQELKLADWKKLQSDMEASVNNHNAKNPSDKYDWNRLPPELGSAKTMVFTIVNRKLMGGIVANLKQGLGTTSRSGIRGSQVPGRGKV